MFSVLVMIRALKYGQKQDFGELKKMKGYRLIDLERFRHDHRLTRL